MVLVSNSLQPGTVLLVGFEIAPSLATFLVDQAPAGVVGLQVAILVGSEMALSRSPPGSDM